MFPQFLWGNDQNSKRESWAIWGQHWGRHWHRHWHHDSLEGKWARVLQRKVVVKKIDKSFGAYCLDVQQKCYVVARSRNDLDISWPWPRHLGTQTMAGTLATFPTLATFATLATLATLATFATLYPPIICICWAGTPVKGATYWKSFWTLKWSSAETKT